MTPVRTRLPAPFPANSLTRCNPALPIQKFYLQYLAAMATSAPMVT
jgi:hypothetical protein